MPRLLLLSLLAAASVHAQEAARDLKVRFLADSPLPETSKLAIDFGKMTAAFDLPLTNLSGPLDVPRSFSMHAQDKEETLAKVTLPENGKEFIVLLIATPDATYKPVVIPDKDPSFEPGSMYFYNSTDKTVVCHIGSSKVVLEPGIGKSLKPEGAENGVYDTAFSVRQGAEIRQINSARWPVDSKKRTYVFFSWNPETKDVAFHMVEETTSSGGGKPKGKSKARK